MGFKFTAAERLQSSYTIPRHAALRAVLPAGFCLRFV